MANLAGRAVGVPRRRGTVLVLILGALALISVVTLVYVTVGKGDRRTAGVANDRNQVDNTVRAVGDYLAGVIARSTFATFANGEDVLSGVRTPILVRRSWDFPFTDSYRKSVIPNATNVTAGQRFDATGSYSDLYLGPSAVAGFDPRLPYEPWLSATMPSELSPDAANPPSVPLDPRLFKDWWSISNFAPDGRFVNLWNLRSNFEALSVDPANAGANNWQPRSGEMSAYVTLLEPKTPGNQLSEYQSQQSGFPNASANQRIFLPGGATLVADRNRPAHWTMWQRGAFRLAGGDPDWGPGQPEYAPYQWADADGDGFFDSRWIELVDATDPLNIVSMLPRDSRFRWFVAARAIDLCSLVNVNTATDARLPAKQQTAIGGVMSPANQMSPLGLYPELDGLRLLRMNDLYTLYSDPSNAAFRGYQLFPQGINPLSDNLNDPAGAYDLASARQIGLGAYGSLRSSLSPAYGQVQGPGQNYLTGGPTDPWYPSSGDQRVRQYTDLGSQAGASYGLVGGTATFQLSSRFGNADLLELLSRRGENDPTTLSRLEQVLDQRGPQAGASNAYPYTTYGPMRSVRTFDTEHNSYDKNPADGLADGAALAAKMLDVRQFLTTDSLARGLTPTVVANGAANRTLSPNELAVDAYDAVQTALGQAVAPTVPPAPAPPPPPLPTKLFKGYADALLPFSGRVDFWGPNLQRLRTLSYSYNPELALRMAAHMTANFVDMYDKGNMPTGYTLLVTDTAANRASLNNNANQTVYPWWSPDNVRTTTKAGNLDLDPDFPFLSGPNRSNHRLPETGNTVVSPAINVFGIEAQPFLTQVVSICVYTDHYNGGNFPGDDDSPPAHSGITIDGTPDLPGNQVSGGNPDFLGQVLAFQLTNPFNVRIQLSHSGVAPQYDTEQNYTSTIADSDYTDFYIQYNHHFFKLALDDNGTLKSVSLQPGETRNFYVVSHDDIQARWNDATGGGCAIPVDAFDRFVDNQLSLPAQGFVDYSAETAGTGRSDNGLTANNKRVRPIKLKWMDPASGASAPAGGDFFADPTPGQYELAGKRNVYLWRVIRPATGTNLPGDRSRHMLADRLRDPLMSGSSQRATLDRRALDVTTFNPTTRQPHQQEIGSNSGVDWDLCNTEPIGVNDNTGFTIALWGSLKRHDDPVESPITTWSGNHYLLNPEIPGYCLEAKWPDAGAVDPANNPLAWDVADADQAKPDALETDRFSDANGNTHFTQFISDMTINSGADPILVAGTGPGGYSHVFITADHLDPGFATMTCPPYLKRTLIARHTLPQYRDANTTPTSYENHRASIYLDNNEFTGALAVTPPVTISTLRLADMLLPMALGPMFDPGVSPQPIVPGSGLGIDPESCMTLSEALALGLNYTNPTPTDPKFGMYYHIADHPAAPPTPPPIISAGAIDRGHLALDLFPPFEDTNNDGMFLAGTDLRSWPGIPMGLNVLNHFRTLDPQFGSLTHGTPGVVNANTASTTVVRLLPLMSPTTDTSLFGGGGPAWNQYTAGSIDPAHTQSITAAIVEDPNADIAASVVAYRDRVIGVTKDNMVVDFQDTAPNPFSIFQAAGARADVSLGRGVREAPGLTSLAEVLNVNDWRTAATTRPLVQRKDQVMGMGRAGAAPIGDPNSNGTLGTLSVPALDIVGADPTGARPGPPVIVKAPDNIKNDYQESLTVGQAALNSMSVRSDVFAVWFVVHGYQKSDTENLGPNDPLVPSIAKRFVMVVDRSNVTRDGEKPKILLFAELPM